MSQETFHQLGVSPEDENKDKKNGIWTTLVCTIFPFIKKKVEKAERITAEHFEAENSALRADAELKRAEAEERVQNAAKIGEQAKAERLQSATGLIETIKNESDPSTKVLMFAVLKKEYPEIADLAQEIVDDMNRLGVIYGTEFFIFPHGKSIEGSDQQQEDPTLGKSAELDDSNIEAE